MYRLRDRLAKMVNQRLIGLLLLLASQVSCTRSSETVSSSNGLEFRSVMDEQQCREACEVVHFESVQLGKITFWVRSRPDLVLARDDLYSIIPMKLSGVSADHPEMIVWSAMLRLRPEAARQVRSFGNKLAPEDRVLISMDGEPLDVAYSRHIGQMMGVGAFTSRDELVTRLGKYAAVDEALSDEVEVFTPEELAAQRQRKQALETSEQTLRTMEDIRRSAAEGKITNEEMLERLHELKRE